MTAPTKEQMLAFIDRKCDVTYGTYIDMYRAIRDVIAKGEPNLPPLSDKAGEAVRRIVDQNDNDSFDERAPLQ